MNVLDDRLTDLGRELVPAPPDLGRIVRRGSARRQRRHLVTSSVIVAVVIIGLGATMALVGHRAPGAEQIHTGAPPARTEGSTAPSVPPSTTSEPPPAPDLHDLAEGRVAAFTAHADDPAAVPVQALDLAPTVLMRVDGSDVAERSAASLSRPEGWLVTAPGTTDAWSGLAIVDAFGEYAYLDGDALARCGLSPKPASAAWSIAIFDAGSTCPSGPAVILGLDGLGRIASIDLRS